MKKRYLNESVFDAAINRLVAVFHDFKNVTLSFSAGKDSGVMLELAIEAARRCGRLPVNVMFIDLEAQYRATIEYATRSMLRPEVNGHWVALPMSLRNAVSQIKPKWICWNENDRESWVREMPGHDCVINESRLCDLDLRWDWFQHGMEFEEFIVKYAQWFSRGEPTAVLVGIRATESLHRFLAVAREGIESKPMWKDWQWTSRIRKNIYNVYPIYDWLPEDVWTANGKMGWDYNRIYDLFYKSGVPMKDMRICQPYGDDQRKGLNLFKILEHETWAKVVARVEGANFGQKYVHDLAMADRGQVLLPPGHTYQSYAHFLLENMPQSLANQYRDKIKKFIVWWEKEGVKEIPDYSDPRMELKKKQPSWRRICKMILKNDIYGKTLSFGLTKADKMKQYEMIMKYSSL